MVTRITKEVRRNKTNKSIQDLERIMRLYLNDNPRDANNSAAKETQVVYCGPVLYYTKNEVFH